jgi:cytochrome c oxidase accessory protein FixG
MTHVDIQPVDSGDISIWKLFEARKPIYPAKVRGRFRRLKWGFMLILLAIYYITPWLRWHRGEGAPDQAVLVDIINRKFYFFFIEIWPQEVIYFVGLLLLAAMGLFFATTLFGRVWCGYACPQTVWTDLFMTVERFFEGDRNAQMKLAKQPWGFSKISRKIAKHATWVVVGLLTGGAWVMYFNDAPMLLTGFLHGDFPFTATFWMMLLTASTYMMAGFAREQVCTYMCPYARFQGVMFDEDSLIVTYDEQRGEPRGNATDPDAGDCVDCGRCVAVCPVGIDIRDGQQYRCINCGLCVDACNTVMEKLERPKGLIRYNTLEQSIPAGAKWWQVAKYARFVRPRTVLYGTIITLVSAVMAYSLLTKPLMEMTVLHQRNPLFVTLSDGSVRNAYTLRVINKTWKDQTYLMNADSSSIKLHTVQVHPAEGQPLPLEVKAGRIAEFTVFADRKKGPYESHKDLVLRVADAAGEVESYTTVFIGPEL